MNSATKIFTDFPMDVDQFSPLPHSKVEQVARKPSLVIVI